MQIAIIDLGTGNLRSVEQALRVVAQGADVVVTSHADAINRADKVVLPGQGAIGTWLKALRERELESAVNQSMTEKPMLGICVGMQAMFASSEEDGGVDGLSLFKGSVRHFSQFHQVDPKSQRLKIPQMGWNQVVQTQDHPLWRGIADRAHFYFVHSFCANSPDGGNATTVGQTDYGHEFIAAAATANVFATQFHPEKSHSDGLRLLKNFTQWNGQP